MEKDGWITVGSLDPDQTYLGRLPGILGFRHTHGGKVSQIHTNPILGKLEVQFWSVQSSLRSSKIIQHFYFGSSKPFETFLLLSKKISMFVFFVREQIIKHQVQIPALW
jgi:hypothetical protein